ncbi:MAG: hypothetical protein ACK5LP_01185 [Campylobacteraceae bacterium]
MKKIFILILFFATFLFAEQQSPYQINFYTEYGKFAVKYRYLELVSLDNDVKLYSIVVNRGNCKNEFDTEYNYDLQDKRLEKSTPKKDLLLQSKGYLSLLNYGDTEQVIVSCENILEVTVSTNKGDWTYSFKK